MEMAKAMGSHSGILVAVCINGACKHYDGNLRAIATVGRIKKEIAELGLDSGRIEVLQVSGPMENVIRDAVERFEGRINE
jgi:coenzyme F420-reducing hydrogenase delta subunit